MIQQSPSICCTALLHFQAKPQANPVFDDREGDMSNPRGYPATLRPPKFGEIRNPKGINGHTKARPVVEALEMFIAERPEERMRELAYIFYAMATGHREALRLPDGTVLDPDFTWFRELLDRLDGKVPDQIRATVTERPEPLSLTDEQLDNCAEARVRMRQLPPEPEPGGDA
jgi:hypothetical protein